MFKKVSQFFAEVFAAADFRESMRENDLVSAREHYSKFQDNEDPRLIAMGARLHLMERNFNKARILLERAISIASQKKGKRHRYICEYCKYYLSRMNGEEDAEDIRLNALAIDRSRTIFDSLPLYRRDKFEDRNMVKAMRQAEKMKP